MSKLTSNLKGAKCTTDLRGSLSKPLEFDEFRIAVALNNLHFPMT